MRTQLVTTAADVISRAMQQGRTLPAALAVALDSAQLLQSPDTAAEFEKLLRWHDEDGKAIDAATRLREDLRARILELEADREASDREYEAATARIAELEAAAETALPWAHTMPESDLHLFLDDLVGAAMNRWRTEADGSDVPDRTTLALVEAACAKWRTPGKGYRSDEPDVYPPALPWARLMDDDDLEEFLADLTAAIIGRDGTAALDEVEKTCGTWRLIAEAQHAHNTAPGPAAQGGAR
ncbi:hypothetical protein ACFWMH_21825 [Streptomyces tendae]|uniref:hypothetical protein n=1 Tax=Streptomyces tendae TaxID=1932 RepID=UPI00364DBA8A